MISDTSVLQTELQHRRLFALRSSRGTGGFVSAWHGPAPSHRTFGKERRRKLILTHVKIKVPYKETLLGVLWVEKRIKGSNLLGTPVQSCSFLISQSSGSSLIKNKKNNKKNTFGVSATSKTLGVPILIKSTLLYGCHITTNKKKAGPIKGPSTKGQ